MEEELVTGNFLIGNRSNVLGGGIYCDLVTELDIVGNTLVDNEGLLSGGGIYLAACTATVSNNIVALSPRGQGIYCSPDSTPTLLNNNVWNNAAGGYGGICISGGASDISADPAFSSAACGGDYRLAGGSPSVDAGDNAAPGLPFFDFESDPRVIDGNGDGLSVTDQGADEFSCLDKDGDGLSACTSPADCDDTDASISPYAPEICDGIDNDCDCQIDEGLSTDGDGDGVSSCAGDCNDASAAIRPGAAETCDGIDNNCNGAIDEGFVDRCVAGAQASLDVSDAIGQPGGSASLTVSLSSTAPVAATSNDLLFDEDLFGGSAPICDLNPAIGPGTAANKSIGVNLVSPGRLRVAVLNISNNNVIPDGDLYTCSFAIDGAAEEGSYALATEAQLSGPLGQEVVANGLAGSITVLAQAGAVGGSVIGDCDGDGTVSIFEVQSTINVFLGIQSLIQCPAADATGDGVVDVTELQNAINNHLGL